MPDSGFFLDYQSSAVPATVEEEEPWEERGLSRRLNTLPGNYHAGLKWCFEAFNATAGVNQDCIAAKGTRRCVEAPSALCDDTASSARLVAPRALTDPGAPPGQLKFFTLRHGQARAEIGEHHRRTPTELVCHSPLAATSTS